MGTDPSGALLRAGGLEARLVGADVRSVRWHGEEVLRHVYVAVRAPDWSTVPGTVDQLEVHSTADAFSVRCTSTHRAGPLHFRWEGTVAARVRNGAAELTMTMRGRALSAYRHNRTGLCLLHPPAVAGTPVVLTTPDGRREQHAFPELIGPQADVDGVLQPVLGPLRSMTLQHRCGPVEVVLDGDDFEVEDQRNWTDASFKTYSTPLALGTPHLVEQGQEVVQQLTLRLPAPPAGTPAPVRQGHRLRVTAGTGVLLGGVGVLTDDAGRPTADAGRELLSLAGLDHVRVEVRSSDPADGVARRIALARALGVPVQLALFLPADPPTAAGVATAALDRLADLPLAAVLVLPDAPPGPASEVTPPELVRVVREVLRIRRPGTAVGGGTAHNFCELNRRRPAPGLLDVVTFPVVPQVHATDDTTIVESHQVLATVVETARDFLGDTPLFVGPVTFRARRPGGDPAAETDPRQGTAFAAAWLLGELAGLLGAGAEAVTAFATAGPHGVLGEASGGAVASSSLAVLAAVAALRGGEVAVVQGHDPVETAALAVVPRDSPVGAARLLLGDLTGRTRSMELPERTGRVLAHGPMGWQPATVDTDGRVAVRPCGLLMLDVGTTERRRPGGRRGRTGPA